MATMKDVAKLAGVSHGTVSNIINGAMGVSLDKVRRVEEAMRELGYEPNATARNLKLSKTMQFDVILPNIVASSLAQIYTNLSMMAVERGYVANLRITNEDAELETRLLNEAMMYNKDGVVLMTCQPQNTALFDRLSTGGLNLVFIEREVEGYQSSLVGISIRQVVRDTVNRLLDQGTESIGIIVGPLEYSFEEGAFGGYVEAHREKGRMAEERFFATSSYDGESALKEAVAMLSQQDIPGAIISTSSQTLAAVQKAIDLLNIPHDNRPLLLALYPPSWTETPLEDVVKIYLPYPQLAKNAFEMLMAKIKGQPTEGKIIEPPTDESNAYLKRQSNVATRPKIIKTLRLLLTEDRAKDAIKTLVVKFEYETGYKVEIEARRYNKMYEAVRDEWYKSKFDVFDLDIPWISELGQRGIIEPLDEYLKSDTEYLEDIPNDIFEEFCVRDGVAYGMPFTFCTQLLFYRKDFFNDLTLKRIFYDQYKKELLPPRTWAEYNEIARFFTRKYNPFAPTEFGTTLGSRISSGGTCEYLPRLWSFGGDVYDENGFTLNSKEAVAALKNYCECFKYASPESVDNWWPEQAAEFRAGRAAIMTTFADNISAVTERDKSQIIGKIGYELVPGKVNVDGGWVLTLNAYSKNKAEAFEFMKWACSRELSTISTILGGFVPRKSVFENMEISKIYPWLRKTSEAKKYGRLRVIPTRADGTHLSEAMFEDILGESVYHAVTGQITPENALNIANAKLNRILFDE